jgi:hypothetical protein
MINTFLPINKNHSMKMLLSSTPHSMVFFSKRFMHRVINPISYTKVCTMTSQGTNSRSMAVFQAWKFKNQNTKIYSNDGEGKHAHGTKVLCTSNTCHDKVCPQVCGPLFKFKIKGNNTHGYPQGKSVVELAKTDYNGNSKPQNWCKANLEKEITSEELKNLTENDMSLNKNATKFFNSKQEIIDKIDN